MFCELCGAQTNGTSGHKAGCPGGAAPPSPVGSKSAPSIPPAPVTRRLATAGLEYLLLVGSLAAIVFFGYLTALVAKLALPVVAIYWAIRDLHGGKYSPGKQLGHFRVVDATTGEVASQQACVLRNSYYVVLIILAALPFWDFFNMILVCVVMLIDVLVMIATPNNRRLGDLLAKTQVAPIR